MDYLIGKEDADIIKNLISNINFNTVNDTITFYNDDIKDVCLNILSGVVPRNTTIRGKFSEISDDDIKICNNYNVNLSLIIENLTIKNTNMILQLINNNVMFNCIITDSFLQDFENRSKLVKIIIENNINIRVMQDALPINKYVNSMRLLQEELYDCGFDLLLNIFDENNLRNCEIECMVIAPDNNIVKNFGKLFDITEKSFQYKFNIDSNMPSYYLLESVSCYSKNGLSYLKNIAVKKLQNRMMINRAPKTIESHEADEFDIIFVYANRFRSTVAIPFPPIGVYYLNTLAESNGFKSKVIECTENSFLEDFKSIKEKTKIVGLYCSCNNEVIVTNIIKYIKNNSDIRVIVGGPQTSSLDKNFFIRSMADIAIVGEGEGALIDLLEYFINNVGDLHDIGNIKYFANNRIYVNPQREIIKNLDSFPFARLKRKDISKYNTTNRLFVLTGRGCPNRCTFCYEGANARKVRYRSMKCVFEEINYLMSEFPMATVIHVLDDTFTCDKKRVYEFCDEMRKIREKRKIEWVCEVHINTVWNNLEMLSYMIDSGLRGFQIGLESGSDMVLKSYKKNTTVYMIKKFIDGCADLQRNLFIEGNIILGGPFESKETINESLEVCKYLISKGRGIVELNTLCFAPLPNTDITNNPDKYGLYIHWDEVDSSILTMSSVVTSSKFLTKEEIEAEKSRIDKEIEEKYIYETLRLSADKVMKFWNRNNNQYMLGSRWGAILQRYEHFKNYALSRTFDNPEIVRYSPSVFPIRTFEKIGYLDINFNKYDIVFSNLEKRILKMCTGKYNVSEIKSALGISSNDAEKYFNLLSEKCLVYYSLF